MGRSKFSLDQVKDLISTLSGKANLTGGNTFNGDQVFDTSTLKIDSVNRRVGIGTDSPTEKLHIMNGNLLVSQGDIMTNQVLRGIHDTAIGSHQSVIGDGIYKLMTGGSQDAEIEIFQGLIVRIQDYQP